MKINYVLLGSLALPVLLSIFQFVWDKESETKIRSKFAYLKSPKFWIFFLVSLGGLAYAYWYGESEAQANEENSMIIRSSQKLLDSANQKLSRQESIIQSSFVSLASQLESNGNQNSEIFQTVTRLESQIRDYTNESKSYMERVSATFSGIPTSNLTQNAATNEIVIAKGDRTAKNIDSKSSVAISNEVLDGKGRIEIILNGNRRRIREAKREPFRNETNTLMYLVYLGLIDNEYHFKVVSGK